MQNLTAADNYKLFCDQLGDAVSRHRGLRIVRTESGRWFLKGILEIRNDDNIIVGNYLIAVRFSPGFPFEFPELYEVGGAIPNEADWHKYKKGNCCMTVKADEKLQCRNGISVLGFIDHFAIPYFANHIYRIITGRYKNGEYAHGPKGAAQFYQSLLKTADRDLWMSYVRDAFASAKYKRNTPCFCGSGKKYKHCHLIVFDKLRAIGKEQVLNDFKLIIL